MREPGYYWIKRSEPDGPSEWEPARYVLHHYEVGVLNAKDLGPCWYIIGHPSPQREITTIGASNRWVVGDRLTPSSPISAAKAGNPEMSESVRCEKSQSPATRHEGRGKSQPEMVGHVA